MISTAIWIVVAIAFAGIFIAAVAVILCMTLLAEARKRNKPR